MGGAVTDLSGDDLEICPLSYRLPDDSIVEGIRKIQDSYAHEAKATCVEVANEIKEYLRSKGYSACSVETSQDMCHPVVLAVNYKEGWFIANSISPTLKQAVFTYEEFQDFKW